MYGKPVKYWENGNTCKCPAPKKKEEACGYLAEDVGKLPGEAVSVYALCFLTGTENMRNGNHTAAFSYFQKAAERGYSKAQYNEGLCHEYGRGTSRDLGKVPTSSPVPRPIPCATRPRVASGNEQWAGCGEVQSLSHLCGETFIF